MAFLMSRLSGFGGPAMPPVFPVEARRGGWPRPVDSVPRCRWERDGEGRIVRRWVLERGSRRTDPPS
jgi:hypothetical protein